MKSKKHLILGTGYVGSFLKNYIKSRESNSQVFSTSRTSKEHLCFDLNDARTWNHLPSVDYCYWTFPTTALSLVKNFYEKKHKDLGQLIVVGSTGSFKVSSPEQIVSEASDLNLHLDRVQGESYLRSQGAILVMASGIYGPGRDPLQWVKDGRVGKNNKLVNMIHVKDLCQFLYNSTLHGEKNNLYIASNNKAHRWLDVINSWEERAMVSNVPFKDPKSFGKRINCSWSIDQLKINLKFPNFLNPTL